MRSVLLATCLAGALVCTAVPARRDSFTIVQPDGTELTVRLVGDEHSHCYLTEDGYLLMEDGGTFYYGNADAATGRLMRSSIKAQPKEMRSAAARDYLEKVDMTRVFRAVSSVGNATTRRGIRFNAPAGPGLFEGTSFPSLGEQKAVVILVQYSDVKFSCADPHDYFSRMLNEQGFADLGGTGSARDFFMENSQGKFIPQFDVYGPVTLSKPMSYYGGNTAAGDDRHPDEMVVEACRLLDGEVDFSQYDRDGDGFIDNVFVFYAGRGENSGGGPDTVWPHSADIMDWDTTPYMFDGVRFNRYGCTNEVTREGRTEGVGVFIHEFSHVLGLPDLYATVAGSGAFTPGSWSALDYGPYNNNGCTPPNYSAFERYALGWLDPLRVTGPCDISLRPVSDNEACLIPTSRDNEFFLLENRQKSGWDAYLPGHGMLVWHIDYNSGIWNKNRVNNNPYHQYVDLEEADGIQNDYSRSGDSYPGSAGVTSFTDDTTPSMKAWSGEKLGLPLTDIAEANGLVTFKVAGGYPAPEAVAALEAVDVTPVGFTARWEMSPVAVSYRLTVVDGADGSFVGGFDGKDVGNVTTAVVSGLAPQREYRYFVQVVNPHGISEPSNEVSVNTPVATFEYMSPVAELTEVTSSSFTARWSRLEGADGYVVDVYAKRLVRPETAGCDFTGGVAGMPEGWQTDAAMTYALSSYVGQSAPSLRLNADDYVQSPVFDDYIHTVSFWHRGNGTTADNRLVISFLADEAGWEEKRVIAVEKATGGAVVTIDKVPYHSRAVRISPLRPEKGSVAIDDIAIEWGGESTAECIAGWDAKTMGNVNECTVGSLTERNVYFCRVTATSGTMCSLPSNELEVLVGSNSALEPADAASPLSIVCYGLELSVKLPVAGAVVVTDVAGRLVSRGYGTDVRLQLPSRGIYVVKSGTHVCKLVVRE